MPQRAAVHLFGEAVDVTAMLGRFDGAGEQCQDSAVEVAGLPVRLVQGAVDPAEVVPVGVAPCGGLFPVADGVRAAGGATRCAGGSGDCGSSGVCASTRCVTPGPSVLPRVRWDNECGDSGRGSIARCPRGVDRREQRHVFDAVGKGAAASAQVWRRPVHGWGAVDSLRPDGKRAVAAATLRRWVSGLNQVHAAPVDRHPADRSWGAEPCLGSARAAGPRRSAPCRRC